ncbi:MAG: glycogen debranching enzyme family protein [Bacteroidales bacterium]|nr:glycogen debranching enzyme family protein [Bacteroidales bacterium]
MSYLNLKQDILSNNAEMLEHEVLLSNKIGCYYSTTLSQCNTRKYHGSLVVPQRHLNNENHVMLSCMKESIVCKDHEIGLSSMLFPNNVELPTEKANIEFADISPSLQYIYNYKGIRIKKSTILNSEQPQLIICYTLLESSKSVALKLQPFFAFRPIHGLQKYNPNISFKTLMVTNGIEVMMKDEYRSIFIQSSQQPMFASQPEWWYNIYYPQEEARGYEALEDLFTVGYLEYILQPNTPLYISISLSQTEPTTIKNRYQKEIDLQPTIESYTQCLEEAAKQFIITNEKETYIKAGFPWFGPWGRDTFIALPGISTVVPHIFENVIDTMKQYMNHGLFPNISQQNNSSYNGADTSLWFFWALQQYAMLTDSHKHLWKKYGNICKEILECYKQGTIYSICSDDNGLIYQGQDGKALTWMDAIVNNKPITQRKGYAVEINALWFNAISFAIELASYQNDEKFIDKWIYIVNSFPKHFQQMFWNEKLGYLADCVNDECKDFSIRPNMIFAVSLPYSPIDQRMQKMVVDTVANKLLTPKGLRSLDCNHKDYHGKCIGTQAERDNSYHQGTVWPWLIGAFADAYHKVYGPKSIEFIKGLYYGMETTLREGCIGSISEIFDGDYPHTSRGAIAQAWSVAELIRMRHTYLR